MADQIEIRENLTARKTYDDDSRFWIEYLDTWEDLTFTEKRAIVEAMRRNWKILPGMKYDRHINKDNGQIFAYKSLRVFINLCHRLDLWQE